MVKMKVCILSTNSRIFQNEIEYISFTYLGEKFLFIHNHFSI